MLSGFRLSCEVKAIIWRASYHLEFVMTIRQSPATIICLVAIFFVHPALALAQLPAGQQEIKYSPQLVSEIKKIQQAALERDDAYRQLAHLTDNIGPRLSGSPQAQAAVEYVAAELR